MAKPSRNPVSFGSYPTTKHAINTTILIPQAIPTTTAKTLPNPRQESAILASESVSAAVNAARRNQQRLSTQLALNQHTIGKCLPQPLCLDDCIPDTIKLPPLQRWTNNQLIDTIKTILKLPVPTLQPPPFQFNLTTGAAAFNPESIQSP